MVGLRTKAAAAAAAFGHPEVRAGKTLCWKTSGNLGPDRAASVLGGKVPASALVQGLPVILVCQ